MYETLVWNDMMVWSTTVKQTGAKDVPLKTTGNEKFEFWCAWLQKGTEQN